MTRLLALFLLASCTAVVPATVAQLAMTDPLTADPAAIALSVALPDGLSVIPGTARLTLSARRGSNSVAAEFALRQTEQTDGMQVFALSPDDAARMRALQAQVAQWTAVGVAKGSLGLGIGACAMGAGPNSDATGSASIRLAANGPFLPLIREAPLADLIGAAALAGIGPCDGPI